MWQSDDSRNPDREILAAARPCLATTGGTLFAIGSPHARKGETFGTYNKHLARTAILQSLLRTGRRGFSTSQQQAFSKVITEDETGRLLYQAMKIAPGSEVKPAPQPAPPSREAEAKLLGPAHVRLHSQAVDHQRANPRLSYESAYSRMYTHPENASLRAEINREHARIGGMTK